MDILKIDEPSSRWFNTALEYNQVMAKHLGIPLEYQRFIHGNQKDMIADNLMRKTESFDIPTVDRIGVVPILGIDTRDLKVGQVILVGEVENWINCNNWSCSSDLASFVFEVIDTNAVRPHEMYGTYPDTFIRIKEHVRYERLPKAIKHTHGIESLLFKEEGWLTDSFIAQGVRMRIDHYFMGDPSEHISDLTSTVRFLWLADSMEIVERMFQQPSHV